MTILGTDVQHFLSADEVCCPNNILQCIQIRNELDEALNIPGMDYEWLQLAIQTAVYTGLYQVATNEWTRYKHTNGISWLAQLLLTTLIDIKAVQKQA